MLKQPKFFFIFRKLISRDGGNVNFLYMFKKIRYKVMKQWVVTQNSRKYVIMTRYLSCLHLIFFRFIMRLVVTFEFRTALNLKVAVFLMRQRTVLQINSYVPSTIGIYLTVRRPIPENPSAKWHNRQSTPYTCFQYRPPLELSFLNVAMTSYLTVYGRVPDVCLFHSVSFHMPTYD